MYSGARRAFYSTSIGHEGSKVDAHYIMNKLCHSTFEPEEIDQIYGSFNEMTAIQRVEGRVTNAAMDRLGICKLPDGEHIDRDNNCLTQSGPVWMTHLEARGREAAWKVRDATAQAAKAVFDAEALLAKTGNDANKRAAADVEKARAKGLSSERKKTDPACMSKAARGKDVGHQKQDRDQKAADAIAAAKALLGVIKYTGKRRAEINLHVINGHILFVSSFSLAAQFTIYTLLIFSLLSHVQLNKNMLCSPLISVLYFAIQNNQQSLAVLLLSFPIFTSFNNESTNPHGIQNLRNLRH